jgi:signal transduction histidine kinase
VEAGPVIAPPPRALYAAGLLTALTGALLVAWFVSGWADVRGRQRAVRDAPRIAAEQRGAELAHELRGQLGAVLAREVERPYFHYQNLFHDPQASAGPSVAPSPLARGSEDPLVLGYFQLDARGQATTPTINDELPELSEPRRLADNRRFRNEVTRSLAAALAPPRITGPLVAAITPAPSPPPGEPGRPPRSSRPAAQPSAAPPPRQVAVDDPASDQAADRSVASDQAQDAPPAQIQQPAQVVTLDRDAYLQNNSSNMVYRNQQRAAPQPAALPTGQPQAAPSSATPPRQASPPQASPPQAPPQQASPSQASPPQAPPPQASPPQASPPQAPPPQASPPQASPPQASPQEASPPQASPPQAPPQQRAASPEVSRLQTPRQGAAVSQAAQQPAQTPQAPSTGMSRAAPPASPSSPTADSAGDSSTGPLAAGPARPRASQPGAPARADAAPPAGPTEPARPIAITVSPLEWRTLEFAGQPAVVAVRQVDTPDGRLAQGFVLDRTALTGWLAAHAGDAVAELRTGDNGSTEVVPGWHLEVAANPRAVLAAAGDATALARGFVLRFAAVGLVAILVAWLVVMVVVRAERLARERSQFAAAAAHELRTPLAGLQLYGDMLADGLGDPSKLRDYARRMSEEASRLGRVVSNVLGFSQLERGNLSVDARPGALDEALRELTERAQPALARAGAVLALDVAPALSATFDRDALARIVGNLLDNAEKYGREASDRTITLAARAAGSAVEVVVSDRGPGIAPPARARLFQPFARGVSGDGPAGLGLGLALSQSLARAMRGELAYRPAPDGGAAFVLTLRPAEPPVAGLAGMAGMAGMDP